MSVIQKIVQEMIDSGGTIRLAVHDGAFHIDDVFSVALLKYYIESIGIKSYEKLNIVRTREQEVYDSCDLIFDVGNRSEDKYFDHHGKEFNECYSCGVKYATLGLVWKDLGPVIVKKLIGHDNLLVEATLTVFENKFVIPVCARDNGQFQFTYTKEAEYPEITLADSLKYLCNFKDDIEFERAVDMVMMFISGMLSHAYNIAELIDRFGNDPSLKCVTTPFDIIIFNKGVDIISLNEHTPLKDKYRLLITYNKSTDMWKVSSYQKYGSSTVMYPAPEQWRGCNDHTDGGDLIKFCHNTGFMLVTNSKQSAISLASKWLGKKYPSISEMQ